MWLVWVVNVTRSQVLVCPEAGPLIGALPRFLVSGVANRLAKRGVTVLPYSYVRYISGAPGGVYPYPSCFLLLLFVPSLASSHLGSLTLSLGVASLNLHGPGPLVLLCQENDNSLQSVIACLLN